MIIRRSFVASTVNAGKGAGGMVISSTAIYSKYKDKFLHAIIYTKTIQT